jgi:hypothetical protein
MAGHAAASRSRAETFRLSALYELKKMKFGIVPADEWRLGPNIEAARRFNLLEAPFEAIVGDVVNEAKNFTVQKEPHCKAVAARVLIQLRLCSYGTDLFHNGAGGYRAQFHLGTETGEHANRYVLNALLARIEHDFVASRHHDLTWEFIKTSVQSSGAKVWIHEGTWLRLRRHVDRNLKIERWMQSVNVSEKRHKKLYIWAQLTPNCETILEVKGGWLNAGLESAGILKQGRSADLHWLGYT